MVVPISGLGNAERSTFPTAVNGMFSSTVRTAGTMCAGKRRATARIKTPVSS